MKTTKYKLAEQVKRLLSGGDPSDDSNLDIREISLALSQNLASLLRKRYYENKSLEFNGLDDRIYFRSRGNKLSNEGGEYYLEIPSSGVDLPNGVDIKNVTDSSNRKSSYVPVGITFHTMFNGLTSHCLSGRKGYYKEGSRLYFTGIEDWRVPKDIDITMILPFGDLDEEEEFEIPDDMQSDLVRMTYDFFAATRNPEDVDNNSKDIN